MEWLRAPVHKVSENKREREKYCVDLTESETPFMRTCKGKRKALQAVMSCNGLDVLSTLPACC